MENYNAINTTDKIRQSIMHKFEVWLDEILSNKENSSDSAREILTRLQQDSTPAKNSADMYSIWCAITSLVHQGQSQTKALETLNSSIDPITEQNRSLSTNLEQLEQRLLEKQSQNQRQLLESVNQSLNQHKNNVQKTAQQAEIKEAIDCLIEVRDCLIPDESRRKNKSESSGGLLTRLVHRSQEPKQANLQQTNITTAERIDKTLAKWEIRTIEAQGKFFNPVTMRAVELVDSTDIQDGMVLEVLKRGYWQGKQVYRPAEVKVVRNQAELEGAK